MLLDSNECNCITFALAHALSSRPPCTFCTGHRIKWKAFRCMSSHSICSFAKHQENYHLETRTEWVGKKWNKNEMMTSGRERGRSLLKYLCRIVEVSSPSAQHQPFGAANVINCKWHILKIGCCILFGCCVMSSTFAFSFFLAQTNKNT